MARALPLLAASRRRMLLLVATIVLGLVASVMAGPNAQAMSPIEKVWARIVLTTLNAERAAHHLPPLRVATRLVSSAHAHNLDMARADTMSHQLPGEPAFTTRISRTGYQWHWVGENIAWNSDISAAGLLMVQRIMYHEVPPDNGHRLNILSRNFKQVGIDVYIDHANGKVWMTQDFGAH